MREDRYNRAPYRRRLLGEVLAALETLGQLQRHPAVFRERLTTVELTGACSEAIRSRGISPAQLERWPGGETLFLAARRDGEGRPWEPATKDRLDYKDDDETTQLRREVDRINTFLSEADITFDGIPMGPVALRRTFLLRSVQDPRAFNLNGRLAGGWWLNLPARDRHRIAINGEGLADLDFKGMFVQLAYRRVDLELSDGFDPYLIPGLEEHREGAKHAMLSVLGRRKRMRAIAPDLQRKLPQGWNARRLMAAIGEHHREIRGLFGADIAVELMFFESQILVGVLLELIALGIPALPMHDGIMVPLSQEKASRRVMQDMSARLLNGAPLPVTRKPIPPPR